MIGTNDGRQFETEFDYLVDVGGWGKSVSPTRSEATKTANRMPATASEKPAGAFSEDPLYSPTGPLSENTLSDADDPIKAWDQLAMMKKETFVGGRRVGEGGGGLSKPANDNSAIDGYFDRIKRSQTYKNLVKERGEPGEFSYQGAMKSLEGLKADIKKRLEGKDFRSQDSRTSHTIPEGLSPDQVNKLKELRGDILGPTAKPDLKVVLENRIPHLENYLGQYAQGKITAKDVQAAFKKEGWKINLRGNRGEAEAFDPSGNRHWLNF